MIYWRLLLLLTLSHLSIGQGVESNLGEDPVFKAVLTRHLKYPRDAEWSSVYGRVFAEFTIDAKGRIQAISILNHSSKGTHFGFEPTIIAALKKMPSLNLRYTGSYILPVSFIYVDYRYRNKPFIPKDTLYVQALRGRVILPDITIFGSSINSKERIRSAAYNESY